MIILILILDNFDSFTYNLVDYFEQLGVKSIVIRNNISLSEINKLKFDAIVLSPGPETPVRAGCLMKVIEHYHQKLPILGICLGHQALGCFFGAKIIKAEKPMHGKVSMIYANEDYLFEGVQVPLQVVRYHSWVVDDLSDPISGIAQASNGEIMALKHHFLPIRGLQFHPEAILTIDGMKILRNWVSFNNIAT